MSAANQQQETQLFPVGAHECVTCGRCACTFAAVHPACPSCSAYQQQEAALAARLAAAETALREIVYLRDGHVHRARNIARAYLASPVWQGVLSDDLVRDLRHMEARAAGDLADWLVHLDLEGKSPRTLYEYSRKVAPLLRAHTDKALQEFTHTDINETLRRLPERSRYISRSIYNSWFTWAVLDERVERNPMDKVARMRQPRRRPKDIFSDSEIALLEASTDGPLWTILFGSGLRRGEARNLRRDHIDLARARLIVYHGKGDKDRIVPLPPMVLAAVADLDLYERLASHDYLWYSLRGQHRYRRTPIGDSTFERWYRRGIQQAGVRYLNPHQTRHTYGWRLRTLGFDLEERQLLMGHESVRTTQLYYGRLTIEDVAEKVALL